MRLRSDRDVIPGGYMAAGIPVLVDWAASDPHADSPHVVLRHVNYGGNPLERTTVLHCVRVPLDGIERVEFTLVPFGEGGRLGPLQHVQLRFIFASGNPPELVDLAGAETGTDAQLSELVCRYCGPVNTMTAKHRWRRNSISSAMVLGASAFGTEKRSAGLSATD
jgi:hypothetical protein